MQAQKRLLSDEVDGYVKQKAEDVDTVMSTAGKLESKVLCRAFLALYKCS